MAWLLPKDKGELPAESTLASSLQCLLIRLVLGPVKAAYLLLPRIFLHSKLLPSCVGLVSLLLLTELGKGDMRESGYTLRVPSRSHSTTHDLPEPNIRKKIPEGGGSGRV